MDTDSLARPAVLGGLLVAATGEEGWRMPCIRMIAGGKSNLTFELTSPAGSLILRRPPTGALLPRAHDMGREARVQRALAGTGVPVPRIVLEQAEPEVLGVPFYVMEKVPGLVLAKSIPFGYATTDAERVALVDALVDTMVALHEIDPDAVGLGDYGRPEGFVARQVRTWTRQWEASKSYAVAAVDELVASLGAHRWAEPLRASIVHGDFRLDNCLFDVTDPSRVNAVLDWELSTIGDPLADLAMMLTYWVEAGEPKPALTPDLTALPGFPGRSHVIARYAKASGRDLSDLPAYVAFAHFKLATIAQGIATRVARGQMAGQHFGDLGAEVDRIASRGLTLLQKAG